MTPLARADHRVQALYEISALLARFDGADRTLPEIVTVTAHALPLRSAVVILDDRRRLSAHVWKIEGSDPLDSNGPLLRARAGYAWFRSEPLPDETPTSRRSLPLRSSGSSGAAGWGGGAAIAADEHRFLLAPLVVKGGRVFGVLQVEGANGLDESDVWFVNATAAQLAVAIAREAAAVDAEARARDQLDVTRALTRSERGQRLLARASAALGDALGHEEAIAALVRCTVPDFADGCTVGDVAKAPAASGVDSQVVVPLAVRGRAFGALTFTMAGSGRRFTDDDVTLAEQLGHRTATALDNARMYRATQDAVRARQDILAIVSHDLRSPLNVIAIATGLLLEGGGELHARERHALEVMGRSAKRMERMTQDLLDVASIEAGHLAVEARPTTVARILEDALEVTAQLAAIRGQTLVVAAADPSLLVLCDRDRILQVLSNLLGNAIKFTPPKGCIELSAEAREGLVWFAVQDDGGGISEALVSHLFERYRQAEDTASKGRGLGLFIAKGIVEAHGGTIEVETLVGQGTTFSFSLPRVAPSLAGTAEGGETRPAIPVP